MGSGERGAGSGKDSSKLFIRRCLIIDSSGRCSQMTDHGQVMKMVLGEDEGHQERGGGSED